MICPMADRECRLQMHSPVGLKRQQKPYENQNNDMQYLNNNNAHDPEILQLIKINNVIIAEGQLAHTYNDQLNSRDQMRTVVKATLRDYKLILMA